MDNHIDELKQLIYTSPTLYDVSHRYYDMIKDDNKELADKLEKYNYLRFQCLKLFSESISSIEMIRDNMVAHVRVSMPNTYFKCEGRVKGFLSFLVKNIYTQSVGLPLSTVKDAIGLRFILYDNTYSSCYQLANVLLDFCKDCGYILESAGSTKETKGFSTEKFPHIKLPSTKESNILKPEYRAIAKDYFIEPKGENAYQSLHFIIFIPFLNENIEIQIRTFDSHKLAEDPKYAGHHIYKLKKYGKFWLNFDPYKVKIQGYGITESGDVFDDTGLLSAYKLEGKYLA